jgi:hypothetical protein
MAPAGDIQSAVLECAPAPGVADTSSGVLKAGGSRHQPERPARMAAQIGEIG